MNYLRFFVFALFASFFILACGDDEGPNMTTDPPDPVDTTPVDPFRLCYVLFDEVGAPFGTFGICKQDDVELQFNDVLFSHEIQNLFNFNDTVPPSAGVSFEMEGIAVWPNPIGSDRVFNIQLQAPGDSFIKLLLVFTDMDDNPFTNHSYRVPANSAVSVQLTEENFPIGTPFRMYFQILGNTDTDILFKGFGNMLLCDAMTSDEIEMECFEE